LPGIGFVGKIALDFLIDQLKPKKIAELYSPHIGLPDGGVGVQVELDSTYTIPKYEIYAYEESPHIILLTGDAQPRRAGQYKAAWNVLDFVSGFGCRTLIALGGYATQRSKAKNIYAVASDQSVRDELKTKFNVQFAQSGMIKGAIGVMLGLGKSRNMKCLGLLSATTGSYPDLQASRILIQLIAEMFKLPVDLTEMDKKITDMESRMEEFRIINVPPLTNQDTRSSHGYIT